MSTVSSIQQQPGRRYEEVDNWDTGQAVSERDTDKARQEPFTPHQGGWSQISWQQILKLEWLNGKMTAQATWRRHCISVSLD
jgi:hypothetical protein